MIAAEVVVSPKERALEGILQLIQCGAVAPGEKLPGERDLCERLGISRTALRGAIKQLCSQGTLESRHGSGTYVLPPKPTQVFQEANGFTGIVTATGRTARSRVVRAEVEAADKRIAQKMGIADGTPLFVLTRVRYADDRPIAIESSRIDLTRCPGINEHDFNHESLLDTIKNSYGIQIAHGLEMISITHVDADEAPLLGVEEGTPAFFEQCFNRDPSEATVEYCRAVILADRYQFGNDDTQHGTTSEKVATWLRS